MIIDDSDFALTRRAFATGMTGSIALAGAAGPAAAAAAGEDSLRADLRDAALRGLARAGDSGDAVLAAKAEATLARLETADPEAALLVRIYRRYDVASWGAWNQPSGYDALPETLDLLHRAVAASRAVAFRYTDLDGDMTARNVLPLAIVHPPQGVKLIAWCEKRASNRQFFVRAMEDVSATGRSFGADRLSLLHALASELA